MAGLFRLTPEVGSSSPSAVSFPMLSQWETYHILLCGQSSQEGLEQCGFSLTC